MGMDASLRSKLIRLAHSRPDVREHVLPLLKEAGFDKSPLGREWVLLDEEYLMDRVDSGATWTSERHGTTDPQQAAGSLAALQQWYRHGETLVVNENTGKVYAMVLKPVPATLK